MGVGSGQGLQAGTTVVSTSIQKFASRVIQQPPYNRGSTQAAFKGSNKDGQTLPKPVPQQHAEEG